MIVPIIANGNVETRTAREGEYVVTYYRMGPGGEWVELSRDYRPVSETPAARQPGTVAPIELAEGVYLSWPNLFVGQRSYNLTIPALVVGGLLVLRLLR